MIDLTDIEEFPAFVRSLPEVDLPFPGCRGWMLQGKDQQVVFIEFSEDVDVPEHSHDDQWEFNVAGKVVLTMDGGTREYLSGENFFIPAGVPHSAKVLAGYKAMILFDSPNRYKPK